MALLAPKDWQQLQFHAHALGKNYAANAPLQYQFEGKSLLLMGEATHGSEEFYRARVKFCQQLINAGSLDAIAIEGDWPHAFRVNRYVRGEGGDTRALDALADFKRFPLWLWRNTVILEFVEWLREHNSSREPEQRVGFYGLDMYSLYESIAAVLRYLDATDRQAATSARLRYGCFDSVGGGQQYGYGVSFGNKPSCEAEVAAQLTSMLRDSAPPDGASDAHFAALQNARLVQHAERYYRLMFDPGVNVWNLRDEHMVDVLLNLREHLRTRLGHRPRIALWEHNSHLGDARATDMVERGQWNVGQLLRQRCAGQCTLLGFTTYSGSVTAASSWDGPAERKAIRPAAPDTLEALLHRLARSRERLNAFYLPLSNSRAGAALDREFWQRAIGVLYLPNTERASHYMRCNPARQFDGLIHIDETHALTPLDDQSHWRRNQADTFPFAT